MIESADDPESDRTAMRRAEPPARAVGVRYLPGMVGESRRQMHLAHAPGPPPSTWEALCGVRIPAELAETFDGPSGMPCMNCLARLVATQRAAEAD